MLLSHHILVKLCLDLVRRRDRVDIKHRFALFFRLFLFYLLVIRHKSLHIRQIDHSNVWHATTHVHKIVHVKTGAIHAVECLLHTVLTDTDITRDMDHLACHALRAAADIADVFILVFVFVRIVILICMNQIIFVFIFTHSKYLQFSCMLCFIGSILL